jgi:glutamate dehydrogenase/leucine dehydrogenase
MTMSQAVCDALLESLSWEHERVQLVQDAETGLRAAIAIHSTVLGPSLGGMRIRPYAGGMAEALDDALRLSRAMTLKASAAGLHLGGGKCVMVDDGDAGPELRAARIVALAREIDRLGGAYITAEDVGTTTADMDLIAEHTRHVVGRSPHDGIGGDPSPATARTVLGAIGAAFGVLDGSDALEGRTVGVIGLGKVGAQLAEWLLEAGARVLAYDAVPAARWRMEDAGVEACSNLEELLDRQMDVLAPCAVGGLIDEDVAALLRCRIVCGAANNPLSGERAADALERRGVLYVPDFLANCGGLIHADGERRGDGDPERLERALDGARARTRAVLLEARESGRLPGAVAAEHAWARLGGVAAAAGAIA